MQSRCATATRWPIMTAGLLTIAWFIATHLPQAQAAKLNVLEYDWLAHGSGYAVMAACWFLWAWARFRAGLVRTGVLVWLVLVFFAVFDEITQPLTGRDCSGYDWIADAAGAAIAVALVPLLVRRFARESRKEEVPDDVHDRLHVAEHHPKRNNP